jgi:DNA-binding SARP family transcriptional activator
LATGSWFTVLGSVRGWQAGSELDVGSPQQRAVLAALLLRHGTPVSVEDMIDALWDEDGPGAAAGTVRTYISRLRRVLESDTAAGPVIRSVAGGYQLDLSAEELDVTVFRRHLADGERARQAGDVATWRAELVNGLELWHGTPLAG